MNRFIKKVIVVLLTVYFYIGICFAETKVYFSPEDGCDKVVISYLKQATKTLDIAIYTFTKDEIADAVIDAYKRGVKIRVIMDRTQAGNKYAEDERLEQNGISLIKVSGSRGGIMHNKFAVIDEKFVITGSYNWTENATSKNDENIVIIDQDSMIKSFKNNFEKLWLTKK